MDISATDRNPEPGDNPLLFSTDSKGSLRCTQPQTVMHTTKPLLNQLGTTGILLILVRFLYKLYKTKPRQRQKTAADVHASDSMILIDEMDDDEPPENKVVKETAQCRRKCLMQN